ncbi:unnamed protein product [Arabidopsis thaliana]|uniref:FBD domain-containing protein n=1 Tax=Arabidopsis thaliana TaxID=3702 RepID=A0A654FDT3_ARATH|nr:unnamed protein product [Arabidopsis thaliana]
MLRSFICLLVRSIWLVIARKCVLKHSPKLENLTIKDLNGYTGDFSMPLNQVRVLHVLAYCGTAEELKHLKSFLEDFEHIELVHVDIEGKDTSIISQATKDLAVSSMYQVKVIFLG